MVQRIDTRILEAEAQQAFREENNGPIREDNPQGKVRRINHRENKRIETSPWQRVADWEDEVRRD